MESIPLRPRHREFVLQRLLLVRHGESEFNRDGIIQGFTECDLSDLGREQAARLRVRLDLERLDVAYSSSARRASQTAQIAAGHRFDISEDPELREINLGVWEGRKATDLKREVPDETDLWFSAPSQLRIDGAEALVEFRTRVTDAIDGIRARHASDSIIIFTHGGAICTYLTSLLGLELDDLWRFKIHNCAITRIIFPRNAPRIEALNDVSHLDGAIR